MILVKLVESAVCFWKSCEAPMQINRFVEIFMKFRVPYLATQPTTPLSSLIVIGLVVLKGAAPYGNLTGPLRDTYGTDRNWIDKLSGETKGGYRKALSWGIQKPSAVEFSHSQQNLIMPQRRGKFPWFSSDFLVIFLDFQSNSCFFQRFCNIWAFQIMFFYVIRITGAASTHPQPSPPPPGGPRAWGPAP